MTAQTNGGGQSPGMGGSEFIIVMLIIFAAFYFIILRPQRKEQQKRQELLGQLKKGDTVISAGGIHGKVLDAGKQDVVIVEVDSQRKTRLTFNRGSISVVNPRKETKKESEPDSSAEKK